jgi:hypothetical protein
MTQDTDAKSAFDGPARARTASKDIFGKLDAEIPSIRINSEVLIVLQRKAASLHMTLSEFVRTRLEVDAFGKQHILNMHADVLERACGNARQEEGDSSLPTFLKAAAK